MTKIRNAALSDLDTLAEIENTCFPAAEAARKSDIQDRLAAYPECFLVLEENGEIRSFINGMRTNDPDLKDEMYENAALHEPDGKWQMIFGLDTRPEYQKQSFAGKILREFIHRAREAGCMGVVLTCKERLVNYYSKFGFEDEGISGSVHGNVLWHQMRLKF